jgi:flavin reductase (DIM6/NTAB) family NADH-FMN oxidoreductase RutF
MDWSFENLSAAQRYKLLVSLVVPRPIALLTSLGPNGVVNAAPFSFFNVLGEDPPIVIVSIEPRGPDTPKDSGRNIESGGEFVVNFVDESIAERMHACAEALPPEQSEVDLVGFTLSPSRAVKPPFIAEAPAALECRLYQTISLPRRQLYIGEVLWLHAREGLVDPATLRVNMDAYFPVGRLFANQYCRTRDRFAIEDSQYLEAMRQLGRI